MNTFKPALLALCLSLGFLSHTFAAWYNDTETPPATTAFQRLPPKKDISHSIAGKTRDSAFLSGSLLTLTTAKDQKGAYWFQDALDFDEQWIEIDFRLLLADADSLKKAADGLTVVLSSKKDGIGGGGGNLGYLGMGEKTIAVAFNFHEDDFVRLYVNGITQSTGLELSFGSKGLMPLKEWKTVHIRFSAESVRVMIDSVKGEDGKGHVLSVPWSKALGKSQNLKTFFKGENIYAGITAATGAKWAKFQVESIFVKSYTDDRMDDAWERQYGLDPTRNDEGEDKDDDGLTNFREYELGYKPNKADSQVANWNDGVVSVLGKKVEAASFIAIDSISSGSLSGERHPTISLKGRWSDKVAPYLVGVEVHAENHTYPGPPKIIAYSNEVKTVSLYPGKYTFTSIISQKGGVQKVDVLEETLCTGYPKRFQWDEALPAQTITGDPFRFRIRTDEKRLIKPTATFTPNSGTARGLPCELVDESGDVFTFACTPQEKGMLTITVDIDATNAPEFITVKDYLRSDPIEVAPMTVTATMKDLTIAYTGKPVNSLEAFCTYTVGGNLPEGEIPVSLLYEVDGVWVSGQPVNAGSYAVTVASTNPSRYTVNVPDGSSMLTIAQCEENRIRWTTTPPAQSVSATSLTLSAEADSKTPITYTVLSGDNIGAIEGQVLMLFGRGTITIGAQALISQNYAASPLLPHTIEVIPADADFTIDEESLEQTYQPGKTAYPVTVTVDNDDLNLEHLTVTYTDSATGVSSQTPPSGAGVYYVTAVFDGQAFAGGTTGTLTVFPARVDVSLMLPESPVYTGEPFPAQAEANLLEGATLALTYNGDSEAPVHAGDYTVLASVAGNHNYIGAATNQMTIAQAPQSWDFQSGTFLTNPSAQWELPLESSAGWEAVYTIIGGKATLVKEADAFRLSFSDVGDVTLRGALKTPEFEDYTSFDDRVAVYRVEKGGVFIELGDLAAVYTGEAHPVSVTTNPEDIPVTVTYNGSPEAPVQVGEYEVVAAVAEDHPTLAGAVTNTLVIAKGQPEIRFALPAVMIAGEAFALTAEASEGLEVTYSVVGENAVILGSNCQTKAAGVLTVKAATAETASWLAAETIATGNVDFAVRPWSANVPAEMDFASLTHPALTCITGSRAAAPSGTFGSTLALGSPDLLTVGIREKGTAGEVAVFKNGAELPVRTFKGPLPGRFGQALAYGDFNADGLPDLAVGAPDAKTAAGLTGSVTVYLGSVYAEEGAVVWSSSNAFTIAGTTAFEAFGSALATAADGLLIGSPGAAGGEGRVYLLRPGSIPASFEAPLSAADLSAIAPPFALSGFGSVIAANARHLIFGLPDLPDADFRQTGGYFTALLPETPWEGDLPLSADTLVYGRTLTINETLTFGTRLGVGVALGDFDADGLPDVVAATALNRLLVTSGSGIHAWQAAMTSPGTPSLTVGDFNNDGIDDLLVGYPAVSQAMLYLGRRDFFGTGNAALPEADGIRAFRFKGEPLSQFGAAISLCRGGLAVSAPLARAGGITEQGAVYLLNHAALQAAEPVIGEITPAWVSGSQMSLITIQGLRPLRLAQNDSVTVTLNGTPLTVAASSPKEVVAIVPALNPNAAHWGSLTVNSAVYGAATSSDEAIWMIRFSTPHAVKSEDLNVKYTGMPCPVRLTNLEVPPGSRGIVTYTVNGVETETPPTEIGTYPIKTWIEVGEEEQTRRFQVLLGYTQTISEETVFCTNTVGELLVIDGSAASTATFGKEMAALTLLDPGETNAVLTPTSGDDSVIWVFRAEAPGRAKLQATFADGSNKVFAIVVEVGSITPAATTTILPLNTRARYTGAAQSVAQGDWITIPADADTTGLVISGGGTDAGSYPLALSGRADCQLYAGITQFEILPMKQRITLTAPSTAVESGSGVFFIAATIARGGATEPVPPTAADRFSWSTAMTTTAQDAASISLQPFTCGAFDVVYTNEGPEGNTANFEPASATITIEVTPHSRPSAPGWLAYGPLVDLGDAASRERFTFHFVVDDADTGAGAVVAATSGGVVLAAPYAVADDVESAGRIDAVSRATLLDAPLASPLLLTEHTDWSFTGSVGQRNVGRQLIAVSPEANIWALGREAIDENDQAEVILLKRGSALETRTLTHTNAGARAVLAADAAGGRLIAGWPRAAFGRGAISLLTVEADLTGDPIVIAAPQGVRGFGEAVAISGSTWSAIGRDAKDRIVRVSGTGETVENIAFTENEADTAFLVAIGSRIVMLASDSASGAHHFRSCAAGDFNGDGLPDLAVADGRGFWIAFDAAADADAPVADLTFLVPTAAEVGYGRSMTTADLNGDGADELIIGSAFSGVAYDKGGAVILYGAPDRETSGTVHAITPRVLDLGIAPTVVITGNALVPPGDPLDLIALFVCLPGSDARTPAVVISATPERIEAQLPLSEVEGSADLEIVSRYGSMGVADAVYYGKESITITVPETFEAEWSGSAVLPPAVTDPEGIALVFSPEPVEPGSYTVTVSSGDERYAGSAECAVTVLKQRQEILLVSPPSAQLDESILPLAITDKGWPVALALDPDSTGVLETTPPRFTGTALGSLKVHALFEETEHQQAAGEKVIDVMVQSEAPGAIEGEWGFSGKTIYRPSMGSFSAGVILHNEAAAEQEIAQVFVTGPFSVTPSSFDAPLAIAPQGYIALALHFDAAAVQEAPFTGLLILMNSRKEPVGIFRLKVQKGITGAVFSLY